MITIWYGEIMSRPCANNLVLGNLAARSPAASHAASAQGSTFFCVCFASFHIMMNKHLPPPFVDGSGRCWSITLWLWLCGSVGLWLCGFVAHNMAMSVGPNWLLIIAYWTYSCFFCITRFSPLCIKFQLSHILKSWSRKNNWECVGEALQEFADAKWNAIAP